MKDPLVSVVMSVYNGEKFLHEAVDSILEQTLREFEFIIIDDGSGDESLSILRAYRRRDSRITICEQDNRGLVAALNRGCALSRGKYIARMDADDISIRTRLASQVNVMERHPEVAVLGGAVAFIDTASNPLGVVARYQNHDIRRKLLDANIIWHPTAMIRRDALIAIGGYRNVRHAEDYDLWLRMSEQYELANLHTVLVKYRVHTGQVSMILCREQALGAASAQIAAVHRRRGMQDPLPCDCDITPELLRRLGVTESIEQSAVARGYLSCARNLCCTGHYEEALHLLERASSAGCTSTEKWVTAESLLWMVVAYWHKQRFGRSIITALRAISERPQIVGRPLRRWCERLGIRRRSDMELE